MIAASSETQSRFAILPPRPADLSDAANGSEEPSGDGLKPFGDDGFTFLDFLDIINPLQHLPVIGTLYRELTGDSLAPASRIAGDVLFGGPIGAFFGFANVFTESATGKDIGGHAFAWLRDTVGPGPDAPPASLVASAAAESSAVAAPVATTAKSTPALAAFQISPATAPSAAKADSALVTAMELTDEQPETVSIADPRRVTFAPPTRSRIPLPPASQGSAAAATAVAVATTATVTAPPNKSAAPPRQPVTTLLGHPPLFAVVPPQSPPAAASIAPAAATPGAAAAPPGAPPAGGTALDGGWFSETMLSALRKYEQDASRRPAAAAPGPAGVSH